jgi:hypothetical protein
MAKDWIFQDEVYTDGPVTSGSGEKTYTEGVWEFDNWKKKGPKLGNVEVKETPSDARKKKFHAKFSLDDGTVINVKGDLPVATPGSGKGPPTRKLPTGRKTTITVEGRNPKRWG